VGTVPAASESIAWTVPDTVTDRALARVTVAAMSDRSDAVFSIERPVVPTITVLGPNDGQVEWREGQTAEITWGSDAVSTVDIALSTDGGSSWGVTVASDLPAVPGSFTWQIPHLADTLLTNSLVVRVAEGTTGSPSDLSDAAFSFRPISLTVATTGELAGVMLFGAFPNPFSGTTDIRWSQPMSARVHLTIFDAAGAVHRRIDGGQRDRGAQSLRLDASALSAGLHPYELRVGSVVTRGTLVIVR
jgi:hypothetical protein